MKLSRHPLLSFRARSRCRLTAGSQRKAARTNRRVAARGLRTLVTRNEIRYLWDALEQRVQWRDTRDDGNYVKTVKCSA